jgi:hypothetical protein
MKTYRSKAWMSNVFLHKYIYRFLLYFVAKISAPGKVQRHD